MLFGAFADACIRCGNLKLLWQRFELLKQKDLTQASKKKREKGSGPWCFLVDPTIIQGSVFFVFVFC